MPLKDLDQQRQYQRSRKSQRRSDWLALHGPCVDCGSWDDLEIDHIDPTTKEYRIAEVWSRRPEVRDAELAKCVPRCKTCHAAKTRSERLAAHPCGTLYSYKGSKNCRCDLCCAANTAHHRERRERLKSAPQK